MMNIMITLLLLFLKPRGSMVWLWVGGDGRDWDESAMMFFREIALLFKPIDTNFFWNKNIQTALLLFLTDMETLP